MYKIYREGNYIRVIDVRTNELFNGAIKEVFVDKSNVQKNEYTISKVKDFNELEVVRIGSILKQDNTTYSTSEWETFYTENTGNFNGGGTAPTIQELLDANNTSTTGIIINEVDDVGVQGNSENNTGGVFKTTNGTHIARFFHGLVERAYILSSGLFKVNRLLVNTNTDNGLDAIQANGTMSALAGVLPNQVVNKAQLDATIQNESRVYLSNDFFAANNTEFLNFVAISGGTLAGGTPTVNNQGVIRIGSSTNPNSGYSIRIPSNTVRIKGNEIFTFIFNPLTFTNTTSRLGIHDSTSSAVPANGVFFRYSGDGLLALVTADNSIQTTSATIATLSLNTWYKVRFTVNANATSVLAELFDASGVLIASLTQTTNIPNNTRAVAVAMNVTNSGTTATNLVDADFVSARLTLTR